MSLSFDCTDLDKPTLRRILEARRQALTDTDRTNAEKVILSRLMSLPAWKHASIVCGYMSTRGEPDLRPVWRAAVASGKTYALPVTLSGAREGQMVFRALKDFCPDRLIRGRYDIVEPPDEADFPILTPPELDGALILVPGLGFDREGFRIGYGGGYYDRFLDALTEARISVHTVGLCPAVCHVERLPREIYDRAVSLVIDETLVDEMLVDETLIGESDSFSHHPMPRA